MEENNGTKIVNITNLPTVNTKSQLNISVDSNTNIQQVINVETCLIDWQVEPMANKALVKGNVGIKVVYVDVDNICSTISDTVAFSETINSELISGSCEIIINNSQFIAEYESDPQSIRLIVSGSIDCLCTSNNNLNTFNQTTDGLIVKKSILSSLSYVSKINKNANYDFNFTLGEKINKMLSCDSKLTVDEIKCYDGYVLISGQIYNTLLYEINNDNCSVKIINNTTPFKCEIEASDCDGDCLADLSAYINLSNTQITTNIGENDTQFDFEYCIVVNGCVYKPMNIDVVDDLYSLNSEVEIISNSYSICKKMPYFKTCENIDTEITLSDEINIDEILGMANSSTNITRYVVKDNSIVIEGVIGGNLIYLDENRSIKNLPTQLPYSVNIKHELDGEVCATNLNVVATNCKCKIKRGNILMIDYEICVLCSAYSTTTTQLINGIKPGKQISYDDVAFQIYVAHANESCWDLCKRLHITQEKLVEYNKENPTTYNGGEKVIVYR